MTQINIEREARDLVLRAEHGTLEDLQFVHEHLTKDMSQMSAKDYDQLLKQMKKDNAADVCVNFHLPTIQFISSTPDGQSKDDVMLNYDHGLGEVVGCQVPGGAGADVPSDQKGQAHGSGGHRRSGAQENDKHTVDATPNQTQPPPTRPSSNGH